MKKLMVFTMNGCSHCSELKKKLNENKIPFHDIEISLNRPLWEKVISLTGLDIIPTVFIQKEADGSGTIYTPGRDFQTSDEIIEIIKKNISENGD